MYSLFSSPGSTVGQGILRDPNWLYCRDGLHRNLSNVINFHRTNPMAVKSDHLLVRLLQSITISQSQNIERYYNNVDTIALNLSMVFKMVSPIFRGTVFDGVFYGQGNTEILIAHDESFNPEYATKDWENQIPIKVLRHPFSDLGLITPDGKNSSDESGLCVIAINISLLAVMYRAFRLNEERLSINMSEDNVDYNENQRSIMHFIRMYVLPNMLPSHLDCVLFNRMSYMESGIPLGESTRKHSFYLTDYNNRLIYIFNNLLNLLHRVDKDFVGILRSMPSVGASDQFNALKLPGIVETRQVIPALFMARLNVLSFLYKIAKNGVGEKNKSIVNQIRRSFLYYGQESMLRTLLPNTILDETMIEIHGIL